MFFWGEKNVLALLFHFVSDEESVPDSEAEEDSEDFLGAVAAFVVVGAVISTGFFFSFSFSSSDESSDNDNENAECGLFSRTSEGSDLCVASGVVLLLEDP